MGFLVNRRTKELYDADIEKVATTYHNWRSVIASETKQSPYQEVQGFCTAATLAEVKALNYVVTPGRYVGLPDDEDDFVFAERCLPG